MKFTPRIDMIGISTSQFEEMVAFYKDIMGFEIKLALEKYAEFKNEGVRFAISTNEVMAEATGVKAFLARSKPSHSFELAFRADSPAEVDTIFNDLITKGATLIKAPADMPWGQRTAFFADPDGNIHEVFADFLDSQVQD